MEKENDNLTRIPQAFTFDTSAITRTYGEQAPLIRDILVFLANKTTTDFFGDSTFTLDDFCKEFGYRKDEMQKTLPQFVDCPESDLPIEGEHCFDSVFEYALYKGFSKVLIFSIKKSSSDGFDLQNMILFNRIRAVYKKTGRNEKRHYLIELDYRIKQMQLKRYFLTDKQKYKDIYIPRKHKLTGGLRNFYLYIGRMISIVKYNISENLQPFYILTVDEIAKIMEIEVQRSDNRKKRIEIYLDKINNILERNSFEYSFFKGEGQRFEYSVKFTFSKQTLDYFDENNKARFFSKLIEYLDRHYFMSTLKDKNINYHTWIRNKSREDEKNMTKWLFTKDEDDNYHVKRYFLDTFKEIYAIEYDGRFGEVL